MAISERIFCSCAGDTTKASDCPLHSIRPQTVVDAELFRSLQDAVDFVAARGGGIVYTDLAGTLFAKDHIKLPETSIVRLEKARPPGSDAPSPS